jgi:ribosomal protein S18
MAETKRWTSHQRLHAPHRRRQSDRNEEAIFPAQESLPVLRREDRRYQLQRRALLQNFISERGKITPRRISGVCAPHQRRLSEAIKQARNIALVPFATSMYKDPDHGSHSKRRRRNLGSGAAQVVKVAPGYARNFLLPKRLAVAATESNKKIVEQEKQAHLRREAKERPMRPIWAR